MIIVIAQSKESSRPTVIQTAAVLSIKSEVTIILFGRDEQQRYAINKTQSTIHPHADDIAMVVFICKPQIFILAYVYYCFPQL
jgi:hypothetical protein